ncbi:hypothetical protein [Legionella genomosp. 1]|uniref:hypothetical protein n=1 Tax=Legionella genomosp. 1 TaxID=1093625 RepID=UPI001055DBA5|nr:hypothetical protein [Legionella genomosp. 1]
MSLPLKAFQHNQLTFTTSGTPVPTSGHTISRVEFLDTDGSIKKGFFKPVDNELYPVLLAKYSVASSVSLRLSMGEFMAEERLVYRDGQIVGTVSFDLPNYKPLLKITDDVPTDAIEKMWVDPSMQTLLEKNVARQLAAWLRIGDEDRHPDNLSLFGGIDFDMCHDRYSKIIRGPRAIDMVTNPDVVRVTSAQIADLPVVEGRTHWPANSYPENFNLLKKYRSTTAFRDLAGSEEFKEQMFEAFTYELLTYDPDVLRSRLTEYLGDEPLDYRSLSGKKIEDLEAANSKLFNATTDKESFVNHMLAVTQEEYDELYRAVVGYPGSEANRRQLKVPSFNTFLEKKPKVVQRIKEWTAAQNKKTAEAVENHSRLIQEIQKRKLTAADEPLEKLKKMEAMCPAYCMSDLCKYDDEKISKRFHKIWRDSFLPHVNQILLGLDNLERSIITQLSQQTLPSIDDNLPELDKSTATESWQLLSKATDLSKISVNCRPDNPEYLALQEIRAFHKELHDIADTYFRTDLLNLSERTNAVFLERMQDTVNKHEKSILDHLGTTGKATDFTNILDKIDRYKPIMKWSRYISRDDLPLYGNKETQSNIKLKSHVDPQVMDACFKQLFAWADEQDEISGKNGDSALTNFIAEIIERNYTPGTFSWFTNRYRATSVLNYIKTTRLKGSEKLAWIFSEGGHETTSLNTHLVNNLINSMLVDFQDEVGCNLASVRHAINTKVFNSAAYTQRIMTYSRTNEKFIHSRSVSAVSNFHNAMYKWVDSFKTEEAFRKFIDDCVKKYLEPASIGAQFASFFVTTKVRDQEVPTYFDKKFGYSRSNILAMILTKGAINDGSLNSILVKAILADMQSKYAVHERAVKHGSNASSTDFKISETDNELETFGAYDSVRPMKSADITHKFLDDLRKLSKDKTVVQPPVSKAPPSLGKALGETEKNGAKSGQNPVSALSCS